MWSQTLILSSLVMLMAAEELPGYQNINIRREMSDGVSSVGYKILYGDEDFSVINEVVQSSEKNLLKKEDHIADSIKPLPAEDVKCLMSVDRYCSKEMGQMKSVLVQAVQEDCAKCTKEQKDEAGRVVAAMMTHDPAAWKVFLTRYGGLQKVQRILG